MMRYGYGVYSIRYAQKGSFYVIGELLFFSQFKNRGHSLAYSAQSHV